MTDGTISKIQLPDNTIYDVVDNTSGYMTGMTILSYGSSTWQNFIDAYSSNKVVYCRASSNSNPASGSQTRLAFMAYVNNATTPTNVEFQYYRSVSSHTASQQGDQVFVYKLDKTAGWSVTTREASVKVVAGTGLGGTYSNGTMTLTGPTKVSDLTNDSGFITGYTETDPVFVASAAHGITSSDITNWNGKQAALVSGTNIKTINNTSILGSGDIVVASSGTSTPTANEIAEFDSNAQMNSTDMSNQDVSDFVDDLNVSGASILDIFYPVGSYYETSDVNFDPNVAWGGTWVMETNGQVHVSAGGGYLVNGANSNTSDGGSKDAVVIYHTHKVSSGWQTASGQPDRITYNAANGGYNSTGNGNVQFIEGVGVAGTDKNMPPYIVVCRWHRTA